MRCASSTHPQACPPPPRLAPLANTSCCFSPDERLLLTGIAAGADGTGGALVFVDVAKGQVVRRVGMPSNAAAVAWHHRLNQIFVGVGELGGRGYVNVRG